MQVNSRQPALAEDRDGAQQIRENTAKNKELISALGNQADAYIQSSQSFTKLEEGKNSTLQIRRPICDHFPPASAQGAPREVVTEAEDKEFSDYLAKSRSQSDIEWLARHRMAR